MRKTLLYILSIFQFALISQAGYAQHDCHLKRVYVNTVEMNNDGTAELLVTGIIGKKSILMLDDEDEFYVLDTGIRTNGTEEEQKLVMTGLNPDKSYRFMLYQDAACGMNYGSGFLSSVALRAGSVTLDEVISLEWEMRLGSNNLIEYQVYRDDQLIYTTPSETLFSDVNVECGKEYTYRIVAIVEGDERSYSNKLVIAPTSAEPEKISNATVTVIDNQTIETTVAVSGEGLTSTYDLVVERAPLGGTNFSVVSPPSNQNLTFVDNDVNTSNSSFCYQFSYKNGCGMRSAPSDAICSVLLNGDSKEVFWTKEKPFLNELDSYELILKDKNGDLIDQLPKRGETRHEVTLSDQERAVASFQVKIFGVAGATSLSNIFLFSTDPLLLVPDAFTPNGDAHNERFMIKSYFVDKYNINIFDRWGSVVFASDSSIESWDGKVNGVDAVPGYYFYKIVTTDTAGAVSSKQGSVLLIR